MGCGTSRPQPGNGNREKTKTRRGSGAKEAKDAPTGNKTPFGTKSPFGGHLPFGYGPVLLASSDATGSKNERRASRLSGVNFVHIRITTALLKKKREMALLKVPITFSKIILRFDKLRSTLKNVVDVFKTLSKDKGGLNLEGLQQSMILLHGELTKAELMELFNFVDIDESKLINLKEFLVALTVGYVLEVIPALVTINGRSVRVPAKPAPPIEFIDTDEDGGDPTKQTFDMFMGQSDQIKEMLNLIVMAYLLFDKEGEGFIRKDAVEQVLEEDGHKTGRSTVLEIRWREMDWDLNGTIDFAEFVYSFCTWIDTNDTMAEADDEPAREAK